MAGISAFSENNMFTGDTIDNPDIPVGYAYFGQFIDHDITFDPTSSLQRQNDPNKLLNLSGTFGFSKEVPIFPFGAASLSLKGFGALRPEHSMQWDWFFDLPTTRPPFPQPAQNIDMKLAQSLFHPPAGPNGMNPLATLNILRNWRMQVPSGSDVARAMGETPIMLDDEIENCLGVYILKEAAMTGGGG